MSVKRSRRHRRWYRKITRGQVGWTVAAVLLLLALIFAWQASRASSALRLAANQAQVLQNQIVAGDDASAKVTLVGLSDSAGQAKASTDGILWDLGSKVPYFGRNVSAVQDISAALDGIAKDALPPVVKLSSQINLNTYSPHDGKVDISAIEKIAPSVADASGALTKANQQIRDINAGSLVVPLRGPVSAIQTKIGEAKDAASSANLAARLLPSMLGKDRQRRYLLLIQSNAEIRSTGGISGSYAILSANNGKLSMGFQGSIQDLRPAEKPVVPLTADELRVYSQALVSDIRDVNLTPDFPRTGEIAKALVAKGLDENVDGVVSVDPVAMSFILGGTGPVTLSDGAVLTQENAVEVLLSAVYRSYPDAKRQDDTFERAARTIFDVVKSGRGESRLAIAGMVRAAKENRLMVWSSRKDEQRLIGPSALSGALSRNDGPTPHVGLYLNDAASTKMEYYLDYATRVTTGRCLDGDVQELFTTTQITSTAPANAADLPESVTGNGLFTPRGTMRLNLRFYSPYEGGFTEMRVNNKQQTVYAGRHLGRNVTGIVLEVKPGETLIVTTAMISGPGQDGDVVFSTTPGVNSTPNDVVTPSACG